MLTAKDLKLCVRCSVEQDPTQFYADKRYKDGYGSYCRSCRRELAREGRRSNVVVARERWRRWAEKNPERIRENSRRSREKLNLQPDRKLQYRLNRYGLTVATFRQLVADQDGACLICEVFLGERLCVDHDHETGVVRGLLCRPCNALLGLLDHDAARAQRVVKYLEQAA